MTAALLALLVWKGYTGRLMRCRVSTMGSPMAFCSA